MKKKICEPVEYNVQILPLSSLVLDSAPEIK